MRPKTIKSLEENIGSNFFDINLRIFLNKPFFWQANKKINYWDYTKIKSFYTEKKTIKIKRQPIEWEKVFTNNISDKGLISRIYKETIQLNAKKNSFKNVQRGAPGCLNQLSTQLGLRS